MSWFSHNIIKPLEKAGTSVTKTADKAFSAHTYTSFKSALNTFARVTSQSQGFGLIEGFLGRNFQKNLTPILNPVRGTATLYNNFNQKSISNHLAAAVNPKTYSTFQGMVKEVSKNPLAGAVVMAGTGGLVDGGMLTTAISAQQTKKISKSATKNVPLVKKAVDYYQDHAGNMIQKDIDHVANEISCDPAAGAGITQGASAVVGVVGSIYTTPAGGAAEATATQIGLSKTFQAGYKTCKNLKNTADAQTALSSNNKNSKKKNYAWLYVTVPIVGSVFI